MQCQTSPLFFLSQIYQEFMSTTTTTTSKAPAKSKEDEEDDFDFETFLRTEANVYNQEKEIKRVLAANEASKNPLEILEIDPQIWTNPPSEASELSTWIPSRQIKLQYRKKSLLCHPDKCKLDGAQDAFQALKEAEGQLQNEKILEQLYNFIRDARYMLQKKKSDTVPMQEIIVQVRRLLRERESRNLLRIKNVEERELNQFEKETKDRKRQMEQEKEWQETRDKRVGSWRKFQTGGPKRKKSRKGEDGLL